MKPIMRLKILAQESIRVPFIILLLSLFFTFFFVFAAEFIKLPHFSTFKLII